MSTAAATIARTERESGKEERGSLSRHTIRSAEISLSRDTLAPRRWPPPPASAATISQTHQQHARGNLDLTRLPRAAVSPQVPRDCKQRRTVMRRPLHLLVLAVLAAAAATPRAAAQPAPAPVPATNATTAAASNATDVPFFPGRTTINVCTVRWASGRWTLKPQRAPACLAPTSTETSHPSPLPSSPPQRDYTPFVTCGGRDPSQYTGVSIARRAGPGRAAAGGILPTVVPCPSK